MKKILASIAAAALTVSAMSVCALASEPVTRPVDGWDNPPKLISADTTVPDELYGAGVEVTFNLTVNDTNGGWANGSAGIIADGETVTETKFGGTQCDAEGNRSWFPEGSVVIADDQKTATVVCKADLTGKSGFNLFIFSGMPTDAADNGCFAVESVTIKNAAGFEATYADGTLTVAGGAADDTNKDDANKDDANKDDANKDDANKDDANKDDANKDDAAGDAAKPTADKTNADTGVEGVAVVAGLAVIAAGAVVVAKKRK